MRLSDINILEKRSVLFSARMRFSPETQPIRETAIDKIIEQNMFVADCEEGLTTKQLEQQGIFCLKSGSIITRPEIQASLERLENIDRIVVNRKNRRKRYRLANNALQELKDLHRNTEQHFMHVVERLFKNTPADALIYKTPFLECLCMIFSKLGERYVRLLKAELSSEDIMKLPNIKLALDVIREKYTRIDYPLFEKRVYSFFQESDPDYDKIKWNMSQNYYIAQALGLDNSGRLLSKEIYGNATFYLDTNIALHALEPKARHYESFKSLSNACRNLHTELKLCQISLTELESAVAHHKGTIKKVVDQIPEETIPRVRGLFLQLYIDEQRKEGAVDLDKLFLSFEKPLTYLENQYSVELVHDGWFMEAATHSATEEFVEEIREAYKARRRYPKGKSAALHDALLLRWISQQRGQNNGNIWLITLDTSLPGLVPKEYKGTTRSLAITLDALLQWIFPIALYNEAEDKVATIFSEAVKYQLLPQENFFDMKDFLVFAEMEWSCKELPADDVEECIRYLKAKAYDLDPSEPHDRERIARELSRFFADPSRKYKTELQDLELEIKEKDKGIVKKEIEHKAQLDAFQRKIDKLEQEGKIKEEKRLEKAQQKSAYRRLGVSFILTVIYEVVILLLANKYGEGLNLFQKLLNAWVFILLGIPIFCLLSWIIIGRKRISTLGWALSKILKSE